MNTNIQDYLRQFTGRDVIYLPNPGNAGDSVIASATYQAMDRVGIRFRTPPQKSFDPAGQFILYGGGGNLNGRTTHSYRMLKRVHRTAKHLTILPHTIKDVDELLSEFGSNVTVIARERVTYEYISGLRRRYEVLLMHDMAFGLDTERLMAGAEEFSPTRMLADFALSRVLRRSGHTGLDNVKRYMKPDPLAAELLTRPQGGVLNYFRLDGEAPGIEIPPGNIDLSIVYTYGVTPVPVSDHAARCLLQALSRFDEVRTNRLHGAISAALLGKKTMFYPNNYYKCRAVYEHSMKDQFPNVTWMG
jgi:exopolysaccharide biosynthesis predicted pyruvyltransferase EpsI